MSFNRSFLKQETLSNLCARLARQVVVTVNRGVWSASIPRLSYPIGQELTTFPLGVGTSADEARDHLCALVSNRQLRLDEGLPTARSITVGTVYADAQEGEALIPYLNKVDYAELELLRAGLEQAAKVVGDLVHYSRDEEYGTLLARLDWSLRLVLGWQQKAIARGVSRKLVDPDQDDAVFAVSA